MTPELKSQLRDCVAERLNDLQHQLNENLYYQEVKNEFKEKSEDFGKLCKDFKEAFNKYSESRTMVEAVEFYEAYLFGYRDCFKMMMYMSSSELLH